MSVQSMAIAVLLVSFLVMILLRFPIAYAVALSSLLCLLSQGLPLTTICQQMVKGISSFSLMAVPFFITMGVLMGTGGISDTERSRIRLQAVAGNIQAFIEHNYMDDISLQTVAEAMNYSDAYFCKIFKQCFDKNFIVYLSEYRVARAKELLGDVLINVKDVSQKVGYRDSNYFAKVFKRIAGVTPTEYRTQVLKEAGER